MGREGAYPAPPQPPEPPGTFPDTRALNKFENLCWRRCSLYACTPKPRPTGQKVTQGHTDDPDRLGLTKARASGP